MSGVPRSQRLIAYVTSTDAFSAAFVCPDNYVVLVKSAAFNNASAAEITASIILTTANQLVSVNAVQVPVPAAGAVEWNGWLVLNPGDQVKLHLTGGVAAAWLSGAILAGAPQFTPVGRELPRQEPQPNPLPT